MIFNMNNATFQAKKQFFPRKTEIEMVFNRTYQSIKNQEQKRFIAMRFLPHISLYNPCEISQI